MELLRQAYERLKPYLDRLKEDPVGWRGDPDLRNRVDRFLSSLSYIGPVESPGFAPAMLAELASIAPTFRYHVYRDSGEREQINGEWRPVLTPQPSFGYFAGFDHDVQSWELRLEGAQKVAEDWYRLSVRTEGVGKVITEIHAVQEDERDLISLPERIMPLPKYGPPKQRSEETIPKGCLAIIENLFKQLAGLFGSRKS